MVLGSYRFKQCRRQYRRGHYYTKRPSHWRKHRYKPYTKRAQEDGDGEDAMHMADPAGDVDGLAGVVPPPPRFNVLPIGITVDHLVAQSTGQGFEPKRYDPERDWVEARARAPDVDAQQAVGRSFACHLKGTCMVMPIEAWLDAKLSNKFCVGMFASAQDSFAESGSEEAALLEVSGEFPGPWPRVI